MKQTQKVQEARIRNYEVLINELNDFDPIFFKSEIEQLKSELDEIIKLNKFV